MSDYRSLALSEIEMLERNGCIADDWGSVNVAEDFNPAYIRNVAFYGEVNLGVFYEMIEVEEGFRRHSGIRNATLCDVTVGDNCLIENIGNHICRYTIGERCYISNVGVIASSDGAEYGEGTCLAVLNEAGDGNVLIYRGLTSQMAALMVASEPNPAVWHQLEQLILDEVKATRPEQGMIGYGVKIVNTREIVNVIIGDDCEISGASKLVDCTFVGCADAGVYIGNDVFCENVVAVAGASIVNGAKLDKCFVGEACHVGKGFSAENCLFFANSYMDNGEACAAFCGPFTVSHHKSTLLIGGQYSFYNAGSGTNYSNHAYKLGPIHYGVLERGSKTASSAHILMPANIGSFSMCMGKIQNHPNTIELPFSYLIASGDTTYIVPGRNIATVGTYRDINKWPKRDKRASASKKSIVNFSWLSPFTMQEVIKGKELLERLCKEQGDNVASYNYNGCLIKNKSLHKGLKFYELAIRMFMGDVVSRHGSTLPESSIGTGCWTDLSGLLAPVEIVEELCDDLEKEYIDTIVEVEDRLQAMHKAYDEYCWNWTYKVILDYLGIDMLSATDVNRIMAEADAARSEWLNAIRFDAEREFALGDVSEDEISNFLNNLE